MSRIAGILYPNAFQVTEMISAMREVHPEEYSFRYFCHKNLELAGFDAEITSNAGQTLWAMIDGEIYNAGELRVELKELGFHFELGTDAELIIHAYDAWKESFLSRFHGPFALAIFDEKREALILARDRIGQKSLYWTLQGDYFLFSSDTKSLIATGITPQTIAVEGIASYLYFGFIPQDLSPIHGVNKLLPCHYLKVDLSRQPTIGQYWSLGSYLKEPRERNEGEIYDKFGSHFEQAIRSSLPKEGKVALHLTGDLGSSALSWFLSHEAPRDRLEGYSTSLSPKIEGAKEMGETLNLSHHIQTISVEDVIRDLPKIVWYLDEPLADINAIQTWYLGERVSSQCSHLYADIGWEEVLGGSSRYFDVSKSTYGAKPPLAFHLAKLPPKIRDLLVLPTLRLFNSREFYRVLRNIDINRDQVAYLMRSALFKKKGRKHVSPYLNQAFDPEIFTQRFHRLSDLPGKLTPSLYYDIKTELPDQLLAQYERLLAKHGVKLLTPFLDSPLIEFLAGVPEKLKFKEEVPGWLLKNLMQRLYHNSPSCKEGEPSIIDTWRLDPRFRELFTHLMDGRLVEEGLISAKWIRTQLGYPYLIERTFRQLWAILVLEVWFRLYINRPIDQDLQHLSLDELLTEG